MPNSQARCRFESLMAWFRLLAITWHILTTAHLIKQASQPNQINQSSNSKKKSKKGKLWLDWSKEKKENWFFHCKTEKVSVIMSDLVICRICLRTDTKSYHYDQFNLKYYYEQITACKVSNRIASYRGSRAVITLFANAWMVPRFRSTIITPWNPCRHNLE